MSRDRASDAAAAATKLWSPFPAQRRFLARREFEVLFGGAAGPGKMLPLDTPVPTPDGWATIGELEAGNLVFDEQGRPTRVLAVHPIEREPETYRLHFDDGTEQPACADHRWLTYDARELAALTRRTPEWRAKRRKARACRGTDAKPWLAERNRENPPGALAPPAGTVRTTAEIAATLLTARGRRNHAIPVAGALELPERELPLAPYLLGCWLGDGHTHAGRISTADPEILAAFAGAGFAHRHYGGYDYGLYGLAAVLRSMGLLGRKQVPKTYLRASVAQRRALLEGLLDSDGCATRDGGVEFTTTSPALRDGVYEVVVSLGWKTQLREGRATLNGRDCGPKWRLSFTPGEYVFRLPRKRARQRPAIRRTTRFRYIVACDRVEPVPMRCITVVAASGLYLVGRSMIPTHNTDALIYGGLRHIDHPRYKAALFRRTFPRLQELIDRTQRTFPQLGAKWNEQKKRWTFPSGAVYEFHHCEHENNKFDYLTTEFQYLGFDQLEEFTDTIYSFLITRVRTTSPDLKTRVRASANPGGIGHVWVMKRFEVDKHPEGGVTVIDPLSGLSRVFIPARVWDNPAIVQHDPAYIQRLMAIPDPALRRAYLDGDWSVFAGQYFSQWDPTLHVSPLRGSKRRPPDWWEVAAGLDWGYSPHPSVLEMAAFDPHGRARFYKELVIEKVSGRELAELILQRCETPKERSMTIQGDTQMWTPNTDTGVSIADSMNEVFTDAGTGVLLTKASKDRINGWHRMHSFLDARRPLPTEPGEPKMRGPWMTVLPADPRDGLGCPYLIETIPGQVHDDRETKRGDLRKNDHDHACDAGRYLLVAREPLAVVPIEERPRPSHGQRVQQRTRQMLMRALKRQAADNGLEGDVDVLEIPVSGEPEHVGTIGDVWN